jgi:hypothetical protein
MALPFLTAERALIFRITHIARPQDFGIKRAGAFQFLHMAEGRKLERVGKRFFLQGVFAQNLQDFTKTGSWREAQCFVAQEKKVLSSRPFGEPAVHDLNHGFDPKGRIAQQLRGGHLSQFFGSLFRSSGQLNMERDEGIARILALQDRTQGEDASRV